MKVTILMVCFSTLLLFSCGSSDDKKANDQNENAVKNDVSDPMKDKGIGPITSVTIGAEVDKAMAAEGEKIFVSKCTACHKPDKRFIGPAPKGVLDRRSPEWVMNMILNPDKMVKENEIAKKLLMEYIAPMANQNLTEKEARSVLEYYRTL